MLNVLEAMKNDLLNMQQNEEQCDEWSSINQNNYILSIAKSATQKVHYFVLEFFSVESALNIISLLFTLSFNVVARLGPVLLVCL